MCSSLEGFHVFLFHSLRNKQSPSTWASLATQGFTTGRHYWEVEVGDKTAWDLGVARESVSRKGVVTLSPEDGYWTICLRQAHEYRACAGQAQLLCLSQRPQVVGVFLDYEDGVVSFYDAEAKSHIYSFTHFQFTEAMFAFFNPDMSDKNRNKSPLIICPVSGVDGGGALDGITIWCEMYRPCQVFMTFGKIVLCFGCFDWN